MRPIETLQRDCPWCGAPIEFDVDLTAGDQSYVEDCQVCCSPILIRVDIGAGMEPDFMVTLTREGD